MPLAGTLSSFSARAYGGFGAKPPRGYNYTLVIQETVKDVNLKTNALAAGWDGVTPLDATIVVKEGVIVGQSKFATLGAIYTDILPANSSLTIVNNGYILGNGGNGGSASSGRGDAGGVAIETTVPLLIKNIGVIGGGGGGGGGGASQPVNYSTIGGSGGGGGAGAVTGFGGTAARATLSNGHPGFVGGYLLGGFGGASNGVNIERNITYSKGTSQFVVPDGVYVVGIKACGAGGGGGGGLLDGCLTTKYYPGGGGGGGGSIFNGQVSVLPGQEITITVGEPGSAGQSFDNSFVIGGEGATNGGTGGTTTLVHQNFVIELNGGTGGISNNNSSNCATNTTPAGGSGGVGRASGRNLLPGYAILTGGNGGSGSFNLDTNPSNGQTIANYGVGGQGGVVDRFSSLGGGGGGGGSLGTGGRGGRFLTGLVSGTVGADNGFRGSGGGGGGGGGRGYGRMQNNGGSGEVTLSYIEHLRTAYIDITVIGAGGGGGGANGNVNIWGGGGGGSGGYVTTTLNLNVLLNYTVVVGAGGAGGTTSFNGATICTGTILNGGNGGLSSFTGSGAAVIAMGGSGGIGAINDTSGPGAGGAGGMPEGVNGGQQRPAQVNFFAPALGGANSSNIGSGGNGNGNNPLICPTAGSNGYVSIIYVSLQQLFMGGTVTSTSSEVDRVWTHEFTQAGTYTLESIIDFYAGSGGHGGDLGVDGGAGGMNSDSIAGGQGGSHGLGVSSGGRPVRVVGNKILGGIA